VRRAALRPPARVVRGNCGAHGMQLHAAAASARCPVRRIRSSAGLCPAAGREAYRPRAGHATQRDSRCDVVCSNESPGLVRPRSGATVRTFLLRAPNIRGVQHDVLGSVLRVAQATRERSEPRECGGPARGPAAASPPALHCHFLSRGNCPPLSPLQLLSALN